MLEHVDHYEARANSFWCVCPAHNDHDPSLHVVEGEDGRALLKCRAGCDQESVVLALEKRGLRRGDLFADNKTGGSVVRFNGRPKTARKPSKPLGHLVKTWEIKDVDGALVALHERYEDSRGDKECLWRRYPGQKPASLKGLPISELPLYGSELISEWPENVSVILSEGEPAADSLRRVKLRGLGTVTGAAGTPGKEVLAILRGRSVILWPDNDSEGHEHMRRVASQLQGIAKSVRWYEPENLPHKGDAADHPAILSADPAALRELKEELVAAPEWRVEAAASTTVIEETAEITSGRPSPPTHDELRDRFLKEHPGYAYGLGGWRIYKNGIWPTVPELQIKRDLCEVIEAAKAEGVKPTNSLLTSVTELTRVKVAVPDDAWDADPDILVCQNGALRISTRELEPHRPEHYTTSAVPYEYDPDAIPVVWRYFLNKTVPEAADFLQEFAGIALTTDMTHELALWLFGPPGSGKSTCLAGFQAMLGHRVGLLGLAEIERSRFTLADLPGKTLVVASEQPSSYLASTNTLNAIISGEPLQVERKYRDPFTVIPRAKVCWAMNELPRVADANSGLFRRVKVVNFPHLPAIERDPKVKEAIEEEGAGILNWALEGLARLKDRGYFEVPSSVEDATKQFRTNNDVPALFVADKCVSDEPDAKVKSSTLYSEYKLWCEENGHRPQSSTRLADDWRRLGYQRKHTNKGNVYLGVRLRLPGE